MALVPDSYTTFKAFGGLDPDQIARLDAVVGQAQASYDQARSLGPNIFQRGWATLIGADSATAAMRTDIAASKTLLDTLIAKRDRLVNDPNAGEYDVQVFEGSREALGNQALQAASDQLSAQAFNEQVIQQSASDLGGMIKNPFGLPWWVWLVGAAGVLVLVKFPSRRR